MITVTAATLLIASPFLLNPSSPGRGLIDASHLVSVSAVWIVLWQQGGATLQNSSTQAAELTAPEGHEPRVLGREQGEESSLRLEL